jgi:Zn-dependent protease with chaperone function
MTAAVIAPAVDVTCVALYGLLGPQLLQSVRPDVATWALSAYSAVAAAAGTVMLTLLALPLLGRSDALTDRAHWSSAVLARDGLAGEGVALVALIALVALLGHTLKQLWRQQRAFRAAVRLANRLGRNAGGLIVTPDPAVDAFALGGRARLIVATEGLMKTLSAEQRRAVLAHERSHLDHRHHRHLVVVTVAATLNPLLWRLPEAMRYLVERWADEDSAYATSRRVTADALAAVADGDERCQPTAALAAAASSVSRRIAMLEAPTQHEGRRCWRVAPPGLLVLAAVVATVVATDHVVDVFQLAATAGRHVFPGHH